MYIVLGPWTWHSTMVDPDTCSKAWSGEPSKLLHFPFSDKALYLLCWSRWVVAMSSTPSTVWASLMPRWETYSKVGKLSCFSLWPRFKSSSLVGESFKKPHLGWTQTLLLHVPACVGQVPSIIYIIYIIQCPYQQDPWPIQGPPPARFCICWQVLQPNESIPYPTQLSYTPWWYHALAQPSPPPLLAHTYAHKCCSFVQAGSHPPVA